jgi:hypothetical protein
MGNKPADIVQISNNFFPFTLQKDVIFSEALSNHFAHLRKPVLVFFVIGVIGLK